MLSRSSPRAATSVAINVTYGTATTNSWKHDFAQAQCTKVTPGNDGPLAIPEDSLVSGNVLVNDSDPNGNPLTVTGFTVADVSVTGGTPTAFSGSGSTAFSALTSSTNTTAAMLVAALSTFVVVPLLAALKDIERSVEEAARALGATPRRTCG